jgi:hypothetical protein
MLAALAGYRYKAVPIEADPGTNMSQPAFPGPVQQSVIDYLRIHSTIPIPRAPPGPINPPQQGVIDYLRAHEHVDKPTTLWDQASRAVLEYLRRHSQ